MRIKVILITRNTYSGHGKPKFREFLEIPRDERVFLGFQSRKYKKIDGKLMHPRIYTVKDPFHLISLRLNEWDARNFTGGIYSNPAGYVDLSEVFINSFHTA